MKKKATRFIAAVITLYLILSILSHSCGASYGAPQNARYTPGEISAKAYCLIDADTLGIICGKNEDVIMGMASTTKIMTALLAIESGKLDSSVTVDKRAVGVEGSSVYLCEGEKVKLRDLVYALMLASANDAAEAIAYFLSGSVECFADDMNRRAKEMGLCNTSFKNPHGLSDKDHYTTARELAVLSAKAMQNEDFAAIVSTKSYSFSSDKTRRTITNHNKMLSMYEGAIGVKTGFTKAVGRCLVSSAKRGSKTLVAVTLSAPDDWRDHKTMLDFGFSLYEERTLARAGEHSFTVYSACGIRKNIALVNKDQLVISCRRDADIKCCIELDRIYYREIHKDDVLGYAVYKSEGREIARLPLTALESSGYVKVKTTFWERLFEFIVKVKTTFWERLSEFIKSFFTG